KTGLASSSSYKWVSRYLRYFNLYDYFKCLVTREDVEKVKPDPSLFLQAAKCLEVDTDKCLVFEDSAKGALADYKAGMKCVAVPNKVTREMSFAHVNRKISSMSEIGLNELLVVI